MSIFTQSRQMVARKLEKLKTLEIKEAEFLAGNEELERKNKELALGVEEKKRAIDLLVNDRQREERDKLAILESLKNQIAEQTKYKTQRESEVANLGAEIIVKTEALEKLSDKEQFAKCRSEAAEQQLADETFKLNEVITKKKEAEKEIKQEKTAWLSQKTALEEEAEKIKKDLTERMEKVLEEERKLTWKKRDLDIYQNRLEKKYPEERIILKE